MRVLIIKTSSMGDVIHTLPALTDAGKIFPDIRFDWIVEENFAEIPSWHPLVDRVIPVALRRWRKKIFSPQVREEWKLVRHILNSTNYDVVIDAQGLVKSALLAHFARGVRCGFDWQSAREPMASIFYQKKFRTAKVKDEHAVTRVRDLFRQALGYDMPTSVADYGIDRQRFSTPEQQQKYLVFLHGTTWATKHWPEEYWIQLAKMASDNGFVVKLPWGSEAEQARAKQIASVAPSIEVLPRLDLVGIAGVLAGAKAVVAVDTGLGHLAAALDVPTVSLYGPTNPVLTGTMGRSQVHLRANFPCSPCLSRECTYRDESPITPPCFSTLPPVVVWNALEKLL